MPISSVVENGGAMEVVLACRHCAAPAMGERFCTSCGMPLSPADVESEGTPAGSPSFIAGDVPGVPPWAPRSEPAPDPRPTQRARQSWRTALAVLVLGALALSCWVLMHGTERHVLSGTVLLIDSSFSGLDPGARCSGTGGYGDINAGAQVVLTDGKGDTMSTAVLSAGEFDGKGCVFSFLLRDVRHADFYGLAIAGANRGQLQYSYAELAGDSWSLQLFLGND